MSRCISGLILGILLTGAAAARAEDAADTMAAFLQQRNQLAAGDAQGRLSLARWCAEHGLNGHRIDLLREAFAIRPDDEIYRELILADRTYERPVEAIWAQKIRALAGERFALLHTRHFTILTDTVTESGKQLGLVLEQTYDRFFIAMGELGLRPLPPPGRLVCLYFEQREDYRDFLRRYEQVEIDWASGFYSWRTNRSVFFHGRDDPVFDDIRGKIAQCDQKILELRRELEVLAEGRASERMKLINEINSEKESRDRMSRRFSAVADFATRGKIRHETAHQLLFNSGLFQRGGEYPFWISEGLACAFEASDGNGRCDPTAINGYRLVYLMLAVENDSLQSLDELLNYQPAEQDDETSVAERYAQAWSLVHYLWTRRPKHLADYLRQIRPAAAAQQRALFEACFGDVRAIEVAMQRARPIDAQSITDQR